MGKFYIIKDWDHICIGKEGPIRSIGDHRPLLLYEPETEKFRDLLITALGKSEFEADMERRIGPLYLRKKGDQWEFQGNYGTYKATTQEVRELLVDLILPAIKIIRRNRSPFHSVLAAPHGGFDLHSEKLVRILSRRLSIGGVIAYHFRYPGIWDKLDLIPLYINVNRPTEGQYRDGKMIREWITSRAGRIYYEYQKALFRASGTNRPPVDLLVEIHAHNRTDFLEMATTGISEDEAAVIKEEIIKQLGYPRVKVEPVDEIYWKASMAKQFGAFRPEMTRVGIHLELPWSLFRKMSFVKLTDRLEKFLGFLSKTINPKG